MASDRRLGTLRASEPEERILKRSPVSIKIAFSVFGAGCKPKSVKQMVIVGFYLFMALILLGATAIYLLIPPPAAIKPATAEDDDQKNDN